MTSDHENRLRLPSADEMGPEPGWERIKIFGATGKHRSFVSGFPESCRFRVTYFTDVQTNHLMAKVWFGPETQGPPGHAHGGAMAAALDEIMGAACWVAHYKVVAAEITIRFKRMIPLGDVVVGEGWVESHEGRKVRTRAVLKDLTGAVCTEGEGLFITLPEAVLSELSRKVVDASIPCKPAEE